MKGLLSVRNKSNIADKGVKSVLNTPESQTKKLEWNTYEDN